jgi:tight adherence protein B
MRRRSLAALLAVAASVVIAAPASAGPPALVETAGVGFPDRAYALTLSEARQLTAGDVEVRENGRPIADVSLTPADTADPRGFGVVLAIDTSYSMRDEPLRNAVAAAREFVRHRSVGQPVAVVTFDGSVDVVLPFSTDQAAIDGALAGIELGGGGSRLLDATSHAVEMARSTGMASASVVVVSDGADRGSRMTLDAVAAAAIDASVRVYGVGLASGSDDFGVLNLMAARTSGEFSAVASPTDLARVYRRLGSRLGHQYLVRYRSATEPGRRVKVEVRVEGVAGVARTTYASKPERRATTPPFRHSPGERLWLSPALSVVLVIVVAGIIFLGIWALMHPRGGGIRDRMAAYIQPAEAPSKDRRPTGRLTNRVISGAARSLDGRAWWQRAAERLDVGRIATPPGRLVAWVVLATAIALMLLPLATGSVAFAALALVVPLAVWRFIAHRVARQRSQFGDQLPDSLQVIASAMRAGHSFAGALAVVVDDAPEPTHRELRRVIADEHLGMPIEEALAGAVRRMESKDLEQVALVAALQRESGGNTAEVLERVTQTVRERLAVRRMVNALTAQGRMSRWVLTAIPIFLLAFITVVNPAYMRPIYTTGIGHALLIVCAVMITAGSLIIKRIVDIKV